MKALSRPFEVPWDRALRLKLDFDDMIYRCINDLSRFITKLGVCLKIRRGFRGYGGPARQDQGTLDSLDRPEKNVRSWAVSQSTFIDRSDDREFPVVAK